MTPMILALCACGAVLLAVVLAGTAARPQSSRNVITDDNMDIERNYSLQAHEAERLAEEKSFTRRNQVRKNSFFDRVIKSMFIKATIAGRRYTPAGYIDKVSEKLRFAGRRGPDELDRFIAVRVITAVAGVVFFVLMLAALQGALTIPNVNQRYLTGVLFVFMLFMVLGPDAKINREAEKRRVELRQTLPDVLDLLTISVEAGLGFEQSIQYVVESMDGALVDEFNRMNAEMRAGQARADALRALDSRVDLEEMKLFVMAILQADKFGVSIANVLRQQADEMRIKRRQLAQEAAQKAPVKMLIPMTFFIFPPLFVVVLGPAIFKIATSLH